MNMMNKPEISPNFTIEDIHKIREYHYEQTKHMTPEERRAQTRKNAEEFQRRIDEIRRAKGINITTEYI